MWSGNKRSGAGWEWGGRAAELVAAGLPAEEALERLRLEHPELDWKGGDAAWR